MKQEPEVAKADRTTVSADKLKQLMSEVISLREKVAQAELVATGCAVRPQNPSTKPKPNCLMLKRSVLTNLLN